MADHDIPFTGSTSALGTTDVDRGQTVCIKNDTGATIYVLWQSGFVDPEPTGADSAPPNDSSPSRTISTSATLDAYYGFQVFDSPPEEEGKWSESPEVGSGSLHIVG